MQSSRCTFAPHLRTEIGDSTNRPTTHIRPSTEDATEWLFETSVRLRPFCQATDTHAPNRGSHHRSGDHAAAQLEIPRPHSHIARFGCRPCPDRCVLSLVHWRMKPLADSSAGLAPSISAGGPARIYPNKLRPVRHKPTHTSGRFQARGGRP